MINNPHKGSKITPFNVIEKHTGSGYILLIYIHLCCHASTLTAMRLQLPVREQLLKAQLAPCRPCGQTVDVKTSLRADW